LRLYSGSSSRKYFIPSAAKLSRHNEVAKAMDYMLKRIDAFTRFLDDGRICLSNNAAERELRGIALGRKAWLFAGSDRGGERAAVMFTLIQTAKLNGIDPQSWLADVLARGHRHGAGGWPPLDLRYRRPKTRPWSMPKDRRARGDRAGSQRSIPGCYRNGARSRRQGS
jgi:hypothetical protein